MDGKLVEVVGDEVDGVVRLDVAEGGKCRGERFAAEVEVAGHSDEVEANIYNNV